jgi:hypothetical protein
VRGAAYGAGLLAAAWAAGACAAPPEAAALFRVWVPQPAAEPSPPLPVRQSPAAERLPAPPQSGVAEPESAERAAIEAPRATGADTPPSAGAQPAEPAPCRVPGMPAILETTQPIELVERGDRVVMRFAEWGVERVVYMQPNRGPPSGQRSPLGASFGRWENGTLAIFTLYIDYPFFDARGTPQSKDVTVLERYTASANGERLDYRVTVTDPVTFTRPVVRQGLMTFDPTAQIEGLVAKDCVG